MTTLAVEQGESVLIVLDQPGVVIVGPPAGQPGEDGEDGAAGPQQFYVGGSQPTPIAVPILWFKDSTAPNALPGDYDVELV